MADEAVPTLPEVRVVVIDSTKLGTPISIGSNLGLTPFQTPASVDVITRKQLQERGDATLVDAITRAPGISSLAHPGNGGSSLSARGFTDTTSVMRLYDGVRQYGGVGLTFPFDTWSIDRIEVMRGPASVIHGDGAIGGVINVIPKKPTRGLIKNEFQVTAGTYNTLRLGFGSGGALHEKLTYRLDVSGNRSDGWVDRGNSSSQTLSGAIQLDVSPDFNMKLSYALGHQKPMRYFGTPLINGQQLKALRHENYNVSDSKIEYTDQWTELSALWTPTDKAIVRSKLYWIDSNRYYRNAETYLYNPVSRLIDRSGNTQIRHDQFQIGNTTSATFLGRLLGLNNQVSIGFDINSSSFKHTNNTYFGSSPSVDPFNPVPGNFASSIPFIPRYRNEAMQFAVFAENRLELSDKWSVIGGLRYDHADISREDLVTGNRAFDKEFSNIGWRIGTVYELQPELAVYGQYAKAADPVSGMLMLSPANSAFGVSTGEQFEIGLKQMFWDKRGEWTLAAYSIEKQNLLTRDPANPALRVQVGQRSAKGIEGTVSLAFPQGFQLDANGSILRAKYDDFSESVGGIVVSRNGNVPTDVPQRLANVWLSWNFLPAWTASTGLRHVGRRFADNANTLKMPAYTTIDVALRWKVAPETILSLHGFNILDTQYFTTSYYTTTQWFNGPGRRFEVALNHRF